jgi:serine/threonine protein kinase/formylglycine-generating enzyme required for sulfatase activity
MSERDIFLAVIDLPAVERDTYLERVCGGDTALRSRVEGLLRSHEDAGSFLNLPGLGSTDPDAGPTRAFDSSRVDPSDGPTGVHGEGGDTDADDALGFLAPPQRPDSLGRLDHYEVLEVLGRGGFGVVFRAFDDVLQRVVAVKVLAPSLATTSPARKRFLREARSAAPIQHENVVRIHDTGEQPLPYLVMEFVRGETLQQRLDRTGPLDVTEALRIGCEIAEGLAAAHEQGLIHRDIKPSNVLIENGPQERAKITDFGLARAADDASLTRSGTVAGTPMYMAPEQARGETLDCRADLFSLGSVLYTMLTGRPPFRAETTLAVLKRVAEDTPRPIREIIPEVPEWFCRIVEKLHAKNPAERYQTAREVADVLADCERQLQAHGSLTDFSRVPSEKSVPDEPRRLRWWSVLLAAVAPAVLFAPGIYFQRDLWSHVLPWVGLVVLTIIVVAWVVVTQLMSPQASSPIDPVRRRRLWKWAGAIVVLFPVLGVLAVALFAWGTRGTGTSPLTVTAHEHNLRVVIDEEPVQLAPDPGAAELTYAATVQLRPGLHRLSVYRGDSLIYEAFIQKPGGVEEIDIPLPVRPGPSPLAAPQTVAEVLPYLAGNWKIERQSLDPKSPPDKDPFVGTFSYSFVAGGKFLRGRSSVLPLTSGHTRGLLDVWSFEPGNNIVRRWVAQAEGWTNGGSVSGQFNTASRTLTTSLRIGEIDSIHQYEFIDSNTFYHHFSRKDGNGAITSEVHHKWTRVAGPVALPNLPPEPNRPAETKILDRLVGEWQNEFTVTAVDSSDKPRAEATRGKTESVLGGRFVESIEGNDLFTLTWFDAGTSQYRQWSFGSSGAFCDLSGAWNQDAQTLTWRSVSDIAVVATDVFKGDNRIEFKNVVRAVDGKTLIEVTGTSTRQVREVPQKAADVIPFFVGTWKTESVVHVPKFPPEAAKSTGVTTNELIAGGKFLRSYGSYANGLVEALMVKQYDAGTDTIRGWFFNSTGRFTGPGAGRWNPDNRTLLWMEKVSGDVTSIHQFDFVDGNTIRTRLYYQNDKNEIVLDVRQTLTRQDRAIDVPRRPPDPKRPPEAAPLDKLIGDWETTGTVKTQENPAGSPFKSAVTLRSILGGRVIESDETNLPGQPGAYWLTTYDENLKAYRFWMFNSAGEVLNLGGGWDEKAQTFQWKWAGADGSNSSSMWRLRGPDMREWTIVIQDAVGKTIFDISATSTRVVKAPPAGVVPFDAKKAKELQEAWAKYLGVEPEISNSVGMKLRVIPPGKFFMGSRDNEIPRADWEGPRHTVTLTRPFAMGTTEVRQSEFQKVLGRNTSHFSLQGEGAKKVAGIETGWLPVDSVGWYDAVEFCVKLSESEKRVPCYQMEEVKRDTTGRIESAKVTRRPEGTGYRLPTEAEWEYACRAGTDDASHFGTVGTADEYGWSMKNSLDRTNPVADKRPNAWGLFDMHGNVWEWCDDRFRTYTDAAVTDPVGTELGAFSLRGGSFATVLGRSGMRRREDNPAAKNMEYGFRVVLVGVAKPEAAPAAAGFVPLFNGKDIKNWRSSGSGWSVVNEVLVGESRKEYSGLCSERDDFTDFHLRVETKVDLKEATASLWFRAKLEPKTNRLVSGYNVRLAGEPSHTESQQTGTLHLIQRGGSKQLHDALKAPVPADTWYQLEVIAQGPKITIKINGSVIAEVVDTGLERGAIGLQIESAIGRVSFRKIEIRELPAPPALTPRDREDLAKLKGEWVARFGARGGKPVPPKDAETLEIRFGDGDFEFRQPGRGAGRDGGTFRIYAADKQLLLYFTGQPVPVRCSYRIEGGALRLGFADRPGAGGGAKPLNADDYSLFRELTVSRNNLKQLVVALHGYHDTSRALPPAARVNPKDGKPLLSWRVLILPYIEQEALYKQFKLDEPWDSENNKKLIDKMPKIFAAPNVKAAGLGLTHYRVFVGPGTVFEPCPEREHGIRLDEVTDGTANTLLIAEAKEAVIWTKPDDLPYDPKKPLAKLGTSDVGILVAMCDGTVSTLAPEVLEPALRALITRNGGEMVPAPFLKPDPPQTPLLYLDCERRAGASEPKKPEPPAKDAPNPAVVQALKDVVAARTRTRDTVKLRLDAGNATKIELLYAEADLIEALIKLAEEERRPAVVVKMLDALVQLRKEERDLIALRVEASADARAVLDAADARLADAKARLAKVKPPAPPEAPAPRPVPKLLRRFDPVKDQTITSGTQDKTGWFFTSREKVTVRLYEIADPALDAGGVLVLRTTAGTTEVDRAYLEIICRFPDGTETRSTIPDFLEGSRNYAAYEIRCPLKPSARPNLIRLNLVFKGEKGGSAFFKEMELWQLPTEQLHGRLAAPTALPRKFEPAGDKSVTYGAQDATGWFFQVKPGQEVIRLFEVENPATDEAAAPVLRGRFGTTGVTGAYLQIVCYFPDGTTTVSDVPEVIAEGNTNSTTYEIRHPLKTGEKPYLIRGNLALKKSNKDQSVFLKELELSQAPTGPKK